MPIIKIHNVETGEIIEREMNSEELAERLLDEERASNEKQLEAATKVKREAAKAKLEALGLTTDDLKALGLGGN